MGFPIAPLFMNSNTRCLDSEVRTANEACAQNEAIHKDKDVEGTFNPGNWHLRSKGSKPPLGKRPKFPQKKPIQFFGPRIQVTVPNLEVHYKAV